MESMRKSETNEEIESDMQTELLSPIPTTENSANEELFLSGLKDETAIPMGSTQRSQSNEAHSFLYKNLSEVISWADVGGLTEQIRELREVVELPLINPESIRRVGITPPKGCLLFGPPGNGKTLLASALETHLDCVVEKVLPSIFNDKTTGETAMIIREIFNDAKDHQACILFMDEVDAIGGFRLGTSADREIKGTLVEMLNQLDGIDPLGKVKVIMATNRPDTLDPSLLRSGRLDRKIEIGLPNEQSRLEILKIHSNKITKHEEIDLETIAKLSNGFSGADLRNLCTEAGLLAIRAEREFVIDEDFKKAVRKVGDAKRLETKLD